MKVGLRYTLSSLAARERTPPGAGLLGVEKRCMRVGYVRGRERDVRLAGPMGVSGRGRW